MLVVSLTVDAAGKPQDIRILRSLAEGVSKKLRPAALSLDENAVKVVREYRFQPAEFQGNRYLSRSQSRSIIGSINYSDAMVCWRVVRVTRFDGTMVCAHR